MEEIEAQITEDADAVVTIANEEAEFCRARAHGPVTVHGPLLVGIDPTPQGFAERADIGYVAGWAGGGDSPNVDAVQWFAREVMPGVQARVPAARLFVTGINPPPEALRLASSTVVFLGSVEELRDFYASVRVIVVPMRYGAGVKNKTIEAMQYGVPTVSTSVGAEGVPVDSAIGSLLVSDDSGDFAARVASLVADPYAWSCQRRRVLAQLDLWAKEDAGEVWPALIEQVLVLPRQRE